MGVIEDVRNLFQDLIAPELKEIKARLDALEKKQDSQHTETMQAIRQITDYTQVLQRVAALEAKQTKAN
jgi:hypothetical protein